MNIVMYEARQARETAKQLIRNNEIGEATKRDIIRNYMLQNEMIAVEMLLKGSQTGLNEQQARNLVNDIAVKAQQLKNEDRKMTETERNNLMNNRKIGLNQVGGKVLNDVYDFINAIGLKADRALGIDGWLD